MPIGRSLLALSALVAFLAPTAVAKRCHADSFSLPSDVLAGASIVDVQARDIKGQEIAGRPPYSASGSIVESTCEVVVTYVHPNTNSSHVQVTVWLPDNWNERFLGTGGGGFMSTIGLSKMLQPTTEGFATAQTDGGLSGLPFNPTYTLLSTGNPNKAAIDRLGHRAIHEMTLLAKEVVKRWYGKAAKTNIFDGCSTGGRQAFMEASRYPEDYDGIVAGAPAVRWSDFVLGSLGGQALMGQANYFPSQCEFEAINEAAVEACDGLDGLVDGLVSRPDLCKFQASAAVGRQFKDDCDGQGAVSEVTATGAKIMQQIMEGLYASDGEKITSGFVWGTVITSPISVANTQVDEKSGRRTFNPLPISQRWAEDLLLYGIQPIDFGKLTVDDVQALALQSKAEYGYAMEPSPDLSAFRNRGGKVLSYHGLLDEIVPVYNSLERYAEVQETLFPRDTPSQGSENMQDFFRLFLLPGVQHCTPYPGAKGTRSTDAHRQLVRWLEEGSAPDRFSGSPSNTPYSNVCLYPSKPLWKSDGSFECQSGVSAWDAIPSLSESITRFLENLPYMLLLDPKPEAKKDGREL